ncbi:MAG TPA: hypothetical protein VJM08_01940 [Anaerolineales bacterium]|nr:hypothetical protein [Anaerolineales bacterium]
MPLLVMAVATTMRAAVYVRPLVRLAVEPVLGVGRADRGVPKVTFTSVVNVITPMMVAQIPLVVTCRNRTSEI